MSSTARVSVLRASSTTSTKIAAGEWIIGGEITPGTYRTTMSDCYYARLSGFLDSIDDIIANGSTQANGGIVEISASDMAFTSRCDWVKIG